MNKTPKQLVQDRFQDKEGLVAAVRKLATDDLWLDRLNEDKGLERVSNAKLLRLHDVLSQVKEAFGSRDALIAEIAKLEKHNDDEGYRARFAKWPTPRLWDHYRAAKKRSEA